ncbi:hypothetical protein [Rhizobium hidalgonense]|uniref:hypothetical protein n=1 Tax=Rhizobium hidalgonense TaxID=1538159 RepID=UPI002870CD6F|nr:hypothetical protein [Rhizobium hidalgonense]MDR9814919.1 hypothetical protein [Rhizobium hidalgonense]
MMNRLAGQARKSDKPTVSFSETLRSPFFRISPRFCAASYSSANWRFALRLDLKGVCLSTMRGGN